TRTFALTVQLGGTPEFPDEEGSDSRREAVLRPLAQVVDEKGIPRGCPLLEIDRLLGPAAGGRWLLAPSDAALPAPLIRKLAERALAGASELGATPVYATVAPGELPRIAIHVRTPRRRGPARAEVTLRGPHGESLVRRSVA